MINILVVPIVDGRVAARVARAEQSDTCLHGDVPARGEHPRVSVAQADAECPAVVATRAAAEVVADIGEVRPDEVSDERFVEPVAAAELHGMEAGGKIFGAERIPVAGGLDGPFIGDRDFGPEVEGGGQGRQGVGPYGENLRRSPVRYAPHGREQCENDELSFHGLDFRVTIRVQLARTKQAYSVSEVHSA